MTLANTVTYPRGCHMKSMYRYLAALVLAVSITSPALAEFTLDNYQKEKASGPLDISTKLYVVGLGDGFVTMNADLLVRHQPPFYCQPPIPMNADNYIAILDKQIAALAGTVAAYPGGFGISIILLEGLKRMFPCK
jgi:hypothetical protein